MKINRPVEIPREKDVVVGDVVKYSGYDCLVVELGSASDDYCYGLLRLEDTYIVKQYEYLSDIDRDNTVTEYAKADNVELNVKELI